MLYSYNWLKEYVPNIPTPEELMEQLTVRSVELEGIEHAFPLLRGIVLGKVLKCEPHPEADRLQICFVDLGSDRVQVVCGGSNVVAGMKVAFAPVGATVIWHGEGDPVVLGEVKIRGVESYGMICASEEIGVANLYPATGEREILDLSHIDAPLGTALIEALQVADTILDIDNKSMTHRADLFSHIGMAREIAAVFNQRVEIPEPPKLPKHSGAITIHREDAEDCPRYMAVLTKVDNTRPTPDFIVQRLALCGIASRSVVVDITNYVMLEYGQPLHAFDAAKFQGVEVMVRRAKAGEQLELLNGNTAQLGEENLVIADAEKPVALAGAMGGQESAVTAQTDEILLEIANFHSATVRLSAKKIGIKTESSLRYEKKPSPVLVEFAARRAVELLHEYADAQILDIEDSSETIEELESVVVDVQQVHRIIGVAIEAATMKQLLQQLGCKVKANFKNTELTITPPWYRRDLRIPEDIVEEVVRLYGVENIPKQPLVASLIPPHNDPEFDTALRAKEFLARMGLHEVMTYSFYGEEMMKLMGYNPEDDEHVMIGNPLSEDLRYLRVSLLPRMLEAVKRNQRTGESIELFEIGHIYTKQREARQIGIVVQSKDNAVRRVRGVVEQVLQDLNVPNTHEAIAATADCPFWNAYHAKQALRYDVLLSTEDHDGDNRHHPVIGTIGQLSAKVQKAWGLTDAVGFAMLSIPTITTHGRDAFTVQTPSPYPAIDIDLSLLMDESVVWQDVEKAILLHESQPIVSIEVIDLYRGSNISEGKKSITCRVVLQSKTETLEMKMVEFWRESLVRDLQAQFGLELRAN